MALIKCSNCGKDISDTTDKCIHCGAPTVKKEENLINEDKKPNEKKKMPTSVKIIIGISIFFGIAFIIGVILVIVLIINVINTPNLKDVAKKVNCDTYYCSVASDGSYLKLDTNPMDLDDYSSPTAYDMMEKINAELKLPEVLNQKMLLTSAIDGRQDEEYDEIEISWTYHPDKGLEILYAIED